MDFRKWILALSILALMVVPSAQAALSCNVSGQTPTIRAEGLTELVGDLTFICQNTSGDTTQTIINPNIQLIFGVVVTSKLMNSVGATEALMVLDEAGVLGQPAPQAGTNVFQGTLIGTNSLQWLGVPIQKPGVVTPNSTRSIRFTNLRVNANSLGVSSTLIPQPVTVFISITGNQDLTLGNSSTASQTLAFVQQGLSVSLRNAADTASAGGTYQQCNSNNKDIAGDTTKNATLDYLIKFTEGFASSFKPIGGAAANYAGFTGNNLTNPAPNGTLPVISNFVNNSGVNVGSRGQTVPGVLYFTESGLLLGSDFTNTGSTNQFYVVNSSSNPIGQATQGTRLFARFNNIPAGVSLFVTSTQVTVTGSKGSTVTTTGNYPTATAIYVGQDPTAGGSGVNPTLGTLVTGTATGSPLIAPTASTGLAQVTLSGGAGTAVWEVTSAWSGSGASIPDTLAFGIVVAYVSNTTSNLPGLTITGTGTTPATAGGGFAPTSTVTVASSTAPVPRFVDTSVQNNLFNVGACVTNLLFPFVTNLAGFDTGMALVNTSLDNAGSKLPFNTATQHGTCTVYYFGIMSGGGALPAPQTTADIAAGQHVSFSLGGGGVAGATSSAQGFEGYVIARCNFQYAHGYAFISNFGIAAGNPSNFAQGYIALIIPDRTRVPDPMSTGGSGTGEQLVH
jgi:hypothetical protein